MPDEHILGQKIKEIRLMTDEEAKAEGWECDGMNGPPPVLVLENGTKLYPSQDPEGNGPGALFGTEPDGESIMVHPHTVPAGG